MKHTCPLMMLFWSGLLLSTAAAQDQTAPTPTSADAQHAELRALREALTEAVLAGDTERQIALAHEQVVTTWQNNDVARGHEGLRRFLNQMNAGASKVFQGYTVPPSADELTILHGGDTGIASGTSVPHYKILGMEFDLENRWTATVVKDDGQWKIAAYHVSANIFDNPVLAAAKASVYWTAGVALLIGVTLGGLGGALLRRRSQPKPPG